MHIDTLYRHSRSHLLTGRVWEEEAANGQRVGRGKIQLVAGGDRRNFRRSWSPCSRR